jgi:hypothetical protein
VNNDVLIISQERASNQSNIKTMVTFTLTPDNADELPRNAVHLIVAEGVTEIPEELCCRYGGGIDSLETVVFSKSVTVFGKEAFYRCPNLRSVVFPKDSQLRVIRRGAFEKCDSLRRIAIPDNVTTIGDRAFHQCTNLESVIFTDQSCLQEIESIAFHSCASLQSIIIPKSVTAIGGAAFASCSKLKEVIFVEHSSIQTIYMEAFHNCASLQFINIPATVTKIGERAFENCPVLQVIDIPHQAEVYYDDYVDRYVFDGCKLLSTTLEKHGTDGMKGRFDALPIHQTCYNFNNDTTHADNNSIINYFHSLQDNDTALLQVDIMGMTPLHILCANPAVTKDMIKQLYIKNTEAGAVRNVNDMLPWHMYVVNKDKQFGMFKNRTTMTDTARVVLSNEFNADTLVEANLDIDTKEMYLILTGSSLAEWLETANEVTGLYPFMSMSMANDYNLEDVYDVAMMNLNSILQRKMPSINRKCGNKWTRDRNAKIMKRV